MGRCATMRWALLFVRGGEERGGGEKVRHVLFVLLRAIPNMLVLLRRQVPLGIQMHVATHFLTELARANSESPNPVGVACCHHLLCLSSSPPSFPFLASRSQPRPVPSCCALCCISLHIPAGRRGGGSKGPSGPPHLSTPPPSFSHINPVWR